MRIRFRKETKLGALIAIAALQAAGFATTAADGQVESRGPMHKATASAKAKARPKSKHLGSVPAKKQAARSLPLGAGLLDRPMSPEEKAIWDAVYQRAKNSQSYLEAGDFRVAEGECRAAMDLAPKTPRGNAPADLRHLLGRIYMAEGRYAEAFAVFRTINVRGSCEVYMATGFELDVALTAAKLGYLEVARNATMGYLGRLGSESFAEVDLPGFASLESAEATVRLARGIDGGFQSKRDAAVGEMREAHRLAPTNPYVRFYYGYALLHVGKYAEGEQRLKEAADSASGDLLVGAKQYLTEAIYLRSLRGDVYDGWRPSSR